MPVAIRLNNNLFNHTKMLPQPRRVRILKMTPVLFSVLHLKTLLLNMALLKYFKSSLPTVKDTGISEIVTREANMAVSQVLTERSNQGHKLTERTV